MTVNLLAIETSTDACSVALRLGEETLVDHRVEPRRHAQLVLPMIDALLAEAGVARAALDGVAFGRGPGSFTGVRVAASVTQGIALGLDIGVVGVSTLACIAEGCRRELGDARVGVALDARLDEIYWGAFETVAGIMSAVVDERVCAAADATLGNRPGGAAEERVAGGGGERGWRLAGAGAERYADVLAATLFVPGEASGEGGRSVNGDELVRAGRLPSARDTLVLAGAVIATDGFGPPESALPVYLRERVARTEAERGVVPGAVRG